MPDEIQEESLKTKLKSRKLHITLVGFVVATSFLWIGPLSGSEWVEFTKWLFGIYVTGNSLEHFSKRGFTNGGSKN